MLRKHLRLVRLGWIPIRLQLGDAVRRKLNLESSITAICQALEPSYAAPVVLLDGILGSWLTLNPTRARDGGISAARRSLSSAARQEFCSAEREERGIESSSSDSSMCR